MSQTAQTRQPTQTLEHEIRVAAPVDRVLEAITTDAGLSAWYGAGMTASGADGEVAFGVAGHPRFRWSAERRSENAVVWTCLEGPGNSVGTQAVYEAQAAADGRTVLRLTHRGWDEDDSAFRRCNTYWGALIFELGRYLETGERRPVFS